MKIHPIYDQPTRLALAAIALALAMMGAAPTVARADVALAIVINTDDPELTRRVEVRYAGETQAWAPTVLATRDVEVGEKVVLGFIDGERDRPVVIGRMGDPNDSSID